MITYKVTSHRGNRMVNEDYTGMYQRKHEFCFLLADGLGGHGMGNIASQLVVEQAVTQFDRLGYCKAALMDMFEISQQKLMKKQRMERNIRGMKSTLVVLIVGKKDVLWGHIGDSRLYYFKDNRLVARTLDHSVPQMLALAGEIKEQEIRHHPDRNRLLKAMGIEWDTPAYELSKQVKREGKQAFLLCSDGFWELIDEKVMTTCLRKSKSVEEWMERMETVVEKRGMGTDMDNYSAITVWIEE